jgi:hypothetical protein
VVRTAGTVRDIGNSSRGHPEAYLDGCRVPMS